MTKEKELTAEERKEILKKAGIEFPEVKPTDVEIGIADLELQIVKNRPEAFCRTRSNVEMAGCYNST